MVRLRERRSILLTADRDAVRQVQDRVRAWQKAARTGAPGGSKLRRPFRASQEELLDVSPSKRLAPRTSAGAGSKLPAWATEADLEALRRGALLQTDMDWTSFESANAVLHPIELADELLAFLLAASSRDAANMRLEIFCRTPGACWRRRIALASELCRYVEERRAA